MKTSQNIRSYSLFISVIILIIYSVYSSLHFQSNLDLVTSKLIEAQNDLNATKASLESSTITLEKLSSQLAEASSNHERMLQQRDSLENAFRNYIKESRDYLMQIEQEQTNYRRRIDNIRKESVLFK